MADDLLSLGSDEPRPQTREERERAKEEESARSDVLNHWWCDETDNKVVDPVGTSGKGDTFGSVGRSVDFGRHRPRYWTPS